MTPKLPPSPLIDSPLIRILDAVVAATLTPVCPGNTEMPAYTPGAAMSEIDLLIVTGPYAPESSAITSPPELVAPSATVNERHGCVTEHGLVSTPYEATNVRC